MMDLPPQHRPRVWERSCLGLCGAVGRSFPWCQQLSAASAASGVASAGCELRWDVGAWQLWMSWPHGLLGWSFKEKEREESQEEKEGIPSGISRNTSGMSNSVLVGGWATAGESCNGAGLSLDFPWDSAVAQLDRLRGSCPHRRGVPCSPGAVRGSGGVRAVQSSTTGT